MKCNTLILLSALIVFTCCNGQNQKPVDSNPHTNPPTLAGDTVAEVLGEIRGITQDADYNMWFATNEDGVFKYDGKTTVQFTEKHGLVKNSIWNVQQAKNGDMWFWQGTRESDIICSFDGKKFTTMQVDTVASQILNYNAQTDDLFGGFYYNGTTLAIIHLPKTSPLDITDDSRFTYDMYCTCKDSKGNLWIGTQAAGVCKYDGIAFTWFDDKELGGAVRCIYEDKSGIIWIGNNGDGLFRYDGKTLTNFSREMNLHNYDFEKYPSGKEGMMSRIWSVTDDQQGNLWIVTIDNGVFMYDGKKVNNYTTKHGLGIDSIWSVYKDKKDNLWFGTAGDGVYTFNGKRFEKFTGAK